MPAHSPPPAASAGTVAEVFRAFLKLGLTSFGGPVAHLGYFRRDLVERKRWVSEHQYAQLVALCQFLPGPASSQLGFTLGMLRAGWAGALAAFVAFTLPSAALLVILAAILPYGSTSPIGQDVIHGLKLVAVAVVSDAVWSMFRNLCPDLRRRGIAFAAMVFTLAIASAWAHILVVIGGAAAGMALCRIPSPDQAVPLQVPHGRRTSFMLVILFTVLLAALSMVSDRDLPGVAGAFYRAGAMVFGGGHVVLPLLEESVVRTGWISQETFLAGYGAAQAIPGPMFSFSAYLGSLMSTGHAGWIGALVALLSMFLPGFLLVSAALPLWQSLSRSARALRAIAGVNAAVVGLLAATLYDPVSTTAIRSMEDGMIAIVAFGLLARWNVSPLWIVLGCVGARVALGMA